MIEILLMECQYSDDTGGGAEMRMHSVVVFTDADK